MSSCHCLRCHRDEWKVVHLHRCVDGATAVWGVPLAYLETKERQMEAKLTEMVMNVGHEVGGGQSLVGQHMRMR